MPQTCCKLLTSLLKIFNKLQQTCQFHQVATSLLKPGLLQLVISVPTCYNLLEKLAASLWITSFDNQLATSLLTTCNRLVINKLSQAIRRILIDVGLLVTNLLQDVKTDFLKLSRFCYLKRSLVRKTLHENLNRACLTEKSLS